ncbi:MAG: substrate-binding domain-containing protein [Firmicutes bacterium]|nr:substrate-binding domain-containing protein [Bacillota bacterium]
MSKRCVVFGLVATMVAGMFLTSSLVAAKAITIAVSVPRLSNPFFGRAVKVVQEAAKQQGVEVIVLDAGDDSAKQLADIETMIIRKVDGVILAPNDQEALVPGVEKLAKAKIPVVTVDRQVARGDYLAHVGGNNVAGAKIAASFIADKLNGQGTVVELLGQPGSSPALQRAKGFEEVMSKYPGIKLIVQPANFRRSDAVTVLENILQANPNIDAIFTHNEEMGLGAIQVLKSRGFKPGQVIVVAFDTHKETLQAIEDGWLQGNIEQFPDQQFRTGLKILLNYIKAGVKPPQRDNYLTPLLITKENITQSEKYGE